MNDRAVNLLEQYDVEILKTRKGRGAFLCDTPDGCLIFKEYSGNEERLNMQSKLLSHLQKRDEIRMEQILPDKEGKLFVTDSDGVKYILKTWVEGRECNVNERRECLDLVRTLAKLHEVMVFEEPAEDLAVNPESYLLPGLEYEKRNKELKRVRKYLKRRSQKTWFEIFLQQNYDHFMEQALMLSGEWKEYEKLRAHRDGQTGPVTYCHGDYQYHNVLRTDSGWFILNFEKCVQDDPVRDLYLLMRKLLEKSNWSAALGHELLAAYEELRPLSALSRIDLYYRLAYPEKFWKIVNFYYNSGKAWIPGRNLEKLERVVEQERGKQEFLTAEFRDIRHIPH
ncbi:MAG: CotS family spore coat protein [Lachnospiraceae bacterium]|nr:CotS family spore coat protein [Lachnospiraceae bacterium]